MMTCIACSRQERSAGYLCDACSARVCGPAALCPEQVTSAAREPTGAALVDQWGRPHPLDATTLVGRRREASGIAIAEPSVSRVHAELSASPSGFRVVDLESSNGTLLNAVRILGPADLSRGDVVSFGHVAFFFFPALARAGGAGMERPTVRPVLVPRLDSDEEDREETFAGVRSARIALVTPSGGGGGVFELDGASVQLPHVQFELVRVLLERMRDEPERDHRVRGFIRSSELQGSLPWDTTRPDENHIKQLVRRLRRALTRAGMPDVIESRHGFGYRLRVTPR